MEMRFLRTLLALLILMVLTVACTAGTSPAPAPQVEQPKAAEADTAPVPEAEQPDKLRVWITWGDNPEQIQALFNQYGDAHNIQIEINAPIDDESKVIAALSGSEPPDILVLGGPDSISTWVGEGLLTPLDDIIAEHQIDLADIYPAMLAQGTYQGKQYALPWGSDTYALYWNKDLFEQAGLDPETPPKTMEEMLEYADKLTKRDADGHITQLGFVPDFSWSHLEQYTALFGGYYVNEDGTKIQLTSQPVVDALKWEQQFYSKYDPEEVLRFVSSFGDYSSAGHGFIDGKVAMMVDGEWFTGDNFIGLFGPELWYGVAPTPYPADHPNLAEANVVAGTVVVIPQGVKSQAASGDLLAWMMSPDIVAEEMVANFNLPSSKKAAEDPRFLENENFARFMDLANSANATHHIFTPVSGEMFNELELIEQAVLHTGADPEPLLQEAEQKLQTMLDEALNK
jgi:multiple sugar transport system substrate-binding protein